MSQAIGMFSDQVLTVDDYCDGPRSGLAELDGDLHVYQAEFDHNTDKYGDTFYLMPIGAELAGLLLERWNIFLRWDAARRKGLVGLEEHPALPEERDLLDRLNHEIGGQLKVEPDAAVFCRGTFEAHGLWKYRVSWERLSQ